MSIKFITGNKNKFLEIQSLLEPIEVEWLNIDLEEIQELDPHKVIRHKLLEALKHNQNDCMVEDQGFYLDCLKGQFPGPLAKWFQQSLGLQGIVELTEKMGNAKATVYTHIGYAKNMNEIHFFEGVQKGTIVQPRGNLGFGWDPIFQPERLTKTFGEMANSEKLQISMRTIAAKKFKEYLNYL